MGYQLNGDSFTPATFSKPIDFIAIFVYTCHFGATFGLLYANIARSYIGAFGTPIGKYVNCILFLSLCWQIILLIYQYTNAPPIIAWLFGFVAAVVMGLSTIGQIEILKSFASPQNFLSERRLFYLQLAFVVWFCICVCPAFLLLPTLGKTPPAIYYQAYSIGYVFWALSNQIAICLCSYRIAHQTKALLQLCRELGFEGQTKRIKRVTIAILVLVMIIVLAMILWVFSWFSPDPDNGVAMSMFLITCSLAGSSSVLASVMFKLLKYHTKRSKQLQVNIGSSQIATVAN
jgi:hypothetical protein